jgi:hypothetical protein
MRSLVLQRLSASKLGVSYSPLHLQMNFEKQKMQTNFVKTKTEMLKTKTKTKPKPKSNICFPNMFSKELGLQRLSGGGERLTTPVGLLAWAGERLCHMLAWPAGDGERRSCRLQHCLQGAQPSSSCC